MLNPAQIFVIGFQRGGTNILTNLLGSHPDTRFLGRETHMVFYGKAREPVAKWFRRLLYLPLLVGGRGHLFRPASLAERRGIPRPLMRYADLLLYRESMANATTQQDTNGTGRLAQSDKRLLCKNVNGLVFVTPLLREMYPDATFIALVRNGLALCEGYTRRGMPAAAFGEIYKKVSERMLDDAARVPNYHIVRFESLISDPLGVIKDVYRHASLDISAVSRYRLQAKRSMERDGKRTYTFGGTQDREIRWFDPSEIGNCFRKDVDASQIALLGERDRSEFLGVASGAMERLGYLGDGAAGRQAGVASSVI
jgi:hypothetical protein